MIEPFLDRRGLFSWSLRGLGATALLDLLRARECFAPAWPRRTGSRRQSAAYRSRSLAA